MEIGLELQEIRFHRPGCFRLAVVCRLGEKRLVHVSEASEIGAVPIWKSKAWRLQAPKDDLDGVEAQLQLRFYEEFGPNSSDCRSLLEAKPLSCCSFTLPLQRLRTLLSSAPVHSAPLFSKGRPGGQDMEEIGVVTISWGWPTSSHTASQIAVVSISFPDLQPDVCSFDICWKSGRNSMEQLRNWWCRKNLKCHQQTEALQPQGNWRNCKL